MDASEQSPLVSVITTVHNGGRWVDQCAQGVLGEAGGELEWLVFDDASTDDTLQRLQRWADRDARVRIIAAPINVGQGVGIERLIVIARGRYAAWLDIDDLALPGRFSRCAEWLAGDSRRVAVYGDVEWTDGEDHPIAPWFVARDAIALRRLGEFSMPAIHSAGMMSLAMLRQRGVGPAVREAYDAYLFLHALAVGEVGWLSVPLVRYRVHMVSMSQTRPLRQLIIGCALRLVAASNSPWNAPASVAVVEWAAARRESFRTEGDVYAAVAEKAWELGLARQAVYHARKAARAGKVRGLWVLLRVVTSSRVRWAVIAPLMRGGLLSAAGVDGSGRSLGG